MYYGICKRNIYGNYIVNSDIVPFAKAYMSVYYCCVNFCQKLNKLHILVI